MKKNILKKFIGIALITAISVSFVGCGGNKKASEETLNKIKDNGKVIVGLSADYAPYEFHAVIDGKDEVVGFDIDLAREVAKDMGVDLEIKEMEFDPLIGALKAGQIDMIISGMNPDEERKKQIDFSDIYYEAKHGVLIKSEDKGKYTKVEDLNGKKIGAQLGSTQEKIAQEKVKDADLQLLANVNNLVLELKTGKVNALITEEPVANMVIKTNPELVLSSIKFEDEGGGNAIGIRKNSPKLLEQLNKTIKRLKDSGELDKFIVNANDLAAKNQSNS
ncbi:MULTISPECIES: transporter substrate-binding domain-containing protein [Clostridium]|uniref:Transporter substrate-binding domain-containing protein n=1 Tax=Clostridium cibarium TaxID=2762247 RepID=A0ABR8PQN7_9CLOT|nr:MULTISPECIES: transporter substrate-binding domain-containing protein [Clostridium]MBD7910489.1 transporter substrate-binding domain-containing protein [Clostridium cibarium]